MPCDQVLIFDTCALINLKLTIPTRQQWWFFDALLKRVEAGTVVVPKHVAKELEIAPHPDMPGAWASGVFGRSPHPTEADYRFVNDVMTKAGQVVEADAEIDKADPWVIALTPEMRSLGVDSVVVTDDVIDRLPVKIAMTAACETCGVPSMTMENSLGWLEDHPVPQLGYP